VTQRLSGRVAPPQGVALLRLQNTAPFDGSPENSNSHNRSDRGVAGQAVQQNGHPERCP